jgi:hypothetical protein
MQRFIGRFLVALLTFAAGVATATLWLAYDQRPATQPTISESPRLGLSAGQRNSCAEIGPLAAHERPDFETLSVALEEIVRVLREKGEHTFHVNQLSPCTGMVWVYWKENNDLFLLHSTQVNSFARWRDDNHPGDGYMMTPEDIYDSSRQLLETEAGREIVDHCLAGYKFVVNKPKRK